MKLESLESRRMFAVSVTEGYPGFFEIHGTEGDDVIVASLNMAEETMTVDGRTYPGVAYVVAYGGAGDDYISITSIDGMGLIGGSVDGGDGHDSIILGVDGGVWAGNGNDSIHLYDSFRGEAYGGAGCDYMYISGACPDAEIRGGDGDDYIDCSGNFYGVVIYGEAGRDTLIGSAYGDQLDGGQGNDVMDGGGGDDMFYAQGGGADAITGGEGNDVAYIDHGTDSCDGVEQVYYE